MVRFCIDATNCIVIKSSVSPKEESRVNEVPIRRQEVQILFAFRIPNMYT